MLLLQSSFSPDNLKYRIYFNWKALFVCIEMYKGVFVRANGFTFENSQEFPLNLMCVCVCMCIWGRVY